jgi:hypothetical protein
MTVQQINTMLYRAIKPGTQYNRFFSSSSCKVVPLAVGNTEVALNKMKVWAKKYAHQGKKVAKELKANTLEQTCKNIHQFLYWHIQYAIDPTDQNLKAPDCLWQTRSTGADCKSYSLFASTILQNLGITHYFRRIRQEAMHKDVYTHVYVVVPKNQNISSKELNQNEPCYIIDGTVNRQTELPYLGKDDLYMEPKLQINGLAAAHLGCGCNSGGVHVHLPCGCKDKNEVLQRNHNFSTQSTSLGMGFTYETPNTVPALGSLLDDVQGIFSSGWAPSCIGGAYDSRDYQVSAPAVITGLSTLYVQFNNALVNQNIELLTKITNDIIQFTKAVNDHATYMANYDWNSRCSRDTTRNWRDLTKYFVDVLDNAFMPYLTKFFRYGTSPANTSNVDHPFILRISGTGFRKDQFVTTFNYRKVNSLEFRGTEDIPSFEFNEYVVDNVQNPNFNLNDFVSSLSQIAVYFQNGGNNSGGGTTGGGNQGSNTGNDNFQPLPGNNTSQAGFGPILGILAIAAVGYGYFTKKKKKA